MVACSENCLADGWFDILSDNGDEGGFVAAYFSGPIVPPSTSPTALPHFVLFNLAEDPDEKNDVIDKHPEIAEKLKAELAEIIESGRSR